MWLNSGKSTRRISAEQTVTTQAANVELMCQVFKANKKNQVPVEKRSCYRKARKTILISRKSPGVAKVGLQEGTTVSRASL